MKRDTLLSCLWGTLLGALLAFGAVGCMITAFGLKSGSLGALFGIFLLLAAAGAICFRSRWGGAALVVCLALSLGLLWHRSDALRQTLGLVEHISRVYHQAYRWGWLELGGSSLSFWPLAILGSLIALAVSRCVSLGGSVFPGVTAALLPLLACVVVTDTVPREDFLFALLLGITVLVLTASVRERSPAQGNLLVALVALPAALFVAVLFLSNPKDSYVNRAGELQQRALHYLEQIPQRLAELPMVFQEMAEGGTLAPPEDQATAVDLREIGPQQEKAYEVMRVSSTAGGVLYLRGQDFDLYSGTGWQSSSRPAEDYPGEIAELVPGGSVSVYTRRLRDVKYLPYYPRQSEQLFSGRVFNAEALTSYSFAVEVLPEGWQQRSLGAPGVVLTQEVQRREDLAAQRYLNLPEETAEAGRRLLEGVLSPQLSRTQAAAAIGQLVRTGAEYDLNTPAMPRGEKDFALWFLEEQDRGYCVHFATSAVVLLRAAGIPARYVTGYMTLAEAGKAVTVTAGQAHAWAEYYEPVLDAWVLLEATPSGSGVITPAPTDPPVTEGTGGTQPEATRPEATDPAPSTQTQPTQPEAIAPNEPQPPAEQPSGEGGSWGWVLAAAVGAALALQSQRQLRLRRRERRLREGQPNARALLLWREAVVLARLTGQDRPPRALEKLAQKAKYSQHTLTEPELTLLAEYLQQCTQRLREKPWYWQPVYRYLYVIY